LLLPLLLLLLLLSWLLLPATHQVEMYPADC
jgi:hypothetical protein